MDLSRLVSPADLLRFIDIKYIFNPPFTPSQKLYQSLAWCNRDGFMHEAVFASWSFVTKKVKYWRADQRLFLMGGNTQKTCYNNTLKLSRHIKMQYRTSIKMGAPLNGKLTYNYIP
jgi:hypothetical protein